MQPSAQPTKPDTLTAAAQCCLRAVEASHDAPQVEVSAFPAGIAYGPVKIFTVPSSLSWLSFLLFWAIARARALSARRRSTSDPPPSYFPHRSFRCYLTHAQKVKILRRRSEPESTHQRPSDSMTQRHTGITQRLRSAPVCNLKSKCTPSCDSMHVHTCRAGDAADVSGYQSPAAGAQISLSAIIACPFIHLFSHRWGQELCTCQVCPAL